CWHSPAMSLRAHWTSVIWYCQPRANRNHFLAATLRLTTFSLKCDNFTDAWRITPDDKLKPIQMHYDPERSGKSAIIVFSNLSRTGSWETSYWDFFRDGTFAVIGRHEDGKIRPTQFEFRS